MNLCLAYLLWLLMVVDNSSFTSRVTLFIIIIFIIGTCGKFPSFVNCYQYCDFKLAFLPLSFYDSLFVHSNHDEVPSLYTYISFWSTGASGLC